MEMMELLKVVLFGIVEGITEWLPISSTGHMILLNEVVSLHVSDEFYSMFQVVIQLGAILAVVLLFFKQIWPFVRKNNEEPLTAHGAGAWIKTDIFKLWFRILVSCVPAAVVGILFDDILEEMFYNYRTVAIMLILFGVAFLIVENRNHGKKAQVTSLKDIQTCVLDRNVSADRRNISGYLPFGRDDRRRVIAWRFKNSCGRIHLLSGNPGHVRGEPAKTREIRSGILSRRDRDPAYRYGGRVCCILNRDQLFNGIYQKARF